MIASTEEWNKGSTFTIHVLLLTFVLPLGWLVKMKVEELADDLLSEEEYNDLVKSIDHWL